MPARSAIGLLLCAALAVHAALAQLEPAGADAAAPTPSQADSSGKTPTLLSVPEPACCAALASLIFNTTLPVVIVDTKYVCGRCGWGASTGAGIAGHACSSVVRGGRPGRGPADAPRPPLETCRGVLVNNNTKAWVMGTLCTCGARGEWGQPGRKPGLWRVWPPAKAPPHQPPHDMPPAPSPRRTQLRQRSC